MKHLRELGQNFLRDESIARSIAAAAEISTGEAVVEIGPGTGILTAQLLEYSPNLIVYELDRRLIPVLQERFGDSIKLFHGDILRQDWEALTATAPLKLVSNLPYQITSPLLELLQRYHQRFSLIVLMLQKEVAQRLEAAPGSKTYGALSLRTQLCFDIETLMQVPRHLFDPVPKVDSTVLVFRPRANPPQIAKLEVFHRLIRLGFSSRRKTLRNNLRPLYDLATLHSLETRSGIDLGRRAETLSEAEFIALSDLL